MRRILFLLTFGTAFGEPDFRFEESGVSWQTQTLHYYAVEYSAGLESWEPRNILSGDGKTARFTLTQTFGEQALTLNTGFLRLREVAQDSTADSDGDDLPDWWELKYQTGYLSPNREANPDGDSSNNFQEYQNGTDPTALDITTEAQLQQAIRNLSDGMKLSLAAGTYNLTNTLNIQENHITITGATGNPTEVILKGAGMDNPAILHGIFTQSTGLTVRDLTIREVYYHAIQLSPGSESPHIANVHMIDIGEQFIKGNSAGFGEGTDDGIVENCRMEYTNGPPTVDHGGGIGYTNGVDVHGGKNWIIRNNVFKNFHKPDNASDQSNYWNPAILMWNGAQNTISENNTFINVDRAIAYGLINRDNDHVGGIIRNNMIVMTPGLYSASRTAGSDSVIIVWDSPNTIVAHNTILTNGNTNAAIEFRFDATNCIAVNNLTDNRIRTRGPEFSSLSNATDATPGLFLDATAGNLRLQPTATTVMDQAAPLPEAIYDIDGHQRKTASDLGAHEFTK